MKHFGVAFAALVIAASVGAQPVPFAPGDVLVVGSVTYDFYNEPLQQLRLFDTNGNLKQLLEYDPGTPIVQDFNGNFYAMQSGGIVEIEDSQRYVISGRITIPESSGVTLAANRFNHNTMDVYILGRSGWLYFVRNRQRTWA